MLSEGGLRLFRDRLQFKGDLRVQKHGMLVFSDFLHNCFYLSLLLKGVQTTSARLVAAHCCRAFVVMDTSFFRSKAALYHELQVAGCIDL